MSSMYYARDILYWSEDDMWHRVKDRRPFILRFDDGEIDTTWGQTMFSWYYWNLHRRWPDAPLEMKHHLCGQPVSKEIENKLQQRAREAVMSVHPDIKAREFYRMFAESTNAISNATAARAVAYENSADALGMLKIYDHPEIQQALREFDGSKRSLQRLYATGDRVMQTAPDLAHDSQIRMYRNGQSKRAQVHQYYLSRGFCSDIHQRIFPRAVRPGYVSGIKKVSEWLMDSRTGSIAQLATTVPVEQSELFNRESQLITYVLHRMDREDCGCEDGIPWEVDRSDLDTVLPGVYHKTERGWVPIRKSDRHLLGQRIEIRSPFTCMHPDDGVVCQKCIGDSARDMDDEANPGFMMTIEMNKDTTQDTISTKHMLASANGEVFNVDPFYTAYITNEINPSELTLAPEIWNALIQVRFHTNDFLSLADITAVPERALAEPSRISEIGEMELTIDRQDGLRPERLVVPVSKGSLRPHISKELMQYMVDNGFDVMGDWVTVDLKQWPSENTMLTFPERRSSTLELLRDFKTAIFMTDRASRLRAKRDINDPEVLSDCLKELSDISNRKFTVNLSITMVIMYCMTVRSIRQSDYRLPKPWTSRMFCPQSRIMTGRSLSGKLAHSRQYELIPDPRSYVDKMRVGHNFDHLLLNVDEWRQRNIEELESRGIKPRFRLK